MTEGHQFDWDEANTEHVARHGVKPEEAEQVMVNDPVELGTKMHEEEVRTVCLGRTDSGRFLVVVYTIRNHRIRIVTAYPVSRRKRRIYEAP